MGTAINWPSHREEGDWHQNIRTQSPEHTLVYFDIGSCGDGSKAVAKKSDILDR